MSLRAKTPTKNQNELKNSIDSFYQAMQGANSPGFGLNRKNDINSLTFNTRTNLVTRHRQALEYLYATNSVVQTFIDVTTDDAFRKGIIISSSELDGDDINLLENYIKDHNVLNSLKSFRKYAKLFGGSGLVINLPQNPMNAIDIDSIEEDTPVAFYPISKWDFWSTNVNVDPMNAYDAFDFQQSHYVVRGQQIHRSKVMISTGHESPPFLKSSLQGWGISELERFVDPLMRNEKILRALHELIDEAKISVYGIKGLFSSILSDSAQTNAFVQAMQQLDALKSFTNGLYLDSEHTFEQRELGVLSSVAGIMEQVRIDIAAAARIPSDILYCQSSNGLGSGEDTVELYNGIVETEREEVRGALNLVIKVLCKKLFGFIPENLDIEFHSLRVLNSEQEENIKNQQLQRIKTSLELGLITKKQAMDMMNQEKILPLTVDNALKDELLSPDLMNLSKNDG